MATKKPGTVYQRSSDKMWMVAIDLTPHPDGRRNRKVIARAKKSEALSELARLRQLVKEEGDLDTVTKPTLNQWIDDWWKRYAVKDLKVTVWDDYESKIRLYIRPSIGHIRIDRLEPKHVHRMHAYVTDTLGLSSSTANGVHQTLRAILRDALAEDLVRRNVAAVTKAPARSTKEEDYLDTADAKKLLAFLDPQNGGVTGELVLRALAYLAGLRQGERLGLTLDKIDMENRLIHVEWELTRLSYKHGCGEQNRDKTWPCGRRKGGYCPKKYIDLPDNQPIRHVEGTLYLVPVKSKAGVRVVPMVGLMYEILSVYLADVTPGPQNLAFTRVHAKTGKRTAISGDIDSRNLVKILDGAGLRKIRGHSARHTCNTLLIELGVSDDVRHAIIGHASKRSNLTYTHTSDPRKIDAMDRIGHELDWRKDDED